MLGGFSPMPRWLYSCLAQQAPGLAAWMHTMCTQEETCVCVLVHACMYVHVCMSAHVCEIPGHVGPRKGTTFPTPTTMPRGSEELCLQLLSGAVFL